MTNVDGIHAQTYIQGKALLDFLQEIQTEKETVVK